MLPPAAINEWFDLPLQQGQVHQVQQHDPKKTHRFNQLIIWIFNKYLQLLKNSLYDYLPRSSHFLLDSNFSKLWKPKATEKIWATGHLSKCTIMYIPTLNPSFLTANITSIMYWTRLSISALWRMFRSLSNTAVSQMKGQLAQKLLPYESSIN